MSEIIDTGGTLPLTKRLAELLEEHFPLATACVANDVPGEDHVYAKSESGKPMFDMLLSSSRGFAFVWYYVHPAKGMGMIKAMKEEALNGGVDFVAKFPNIPKKSTGYPSIFR